MARPCVDCAVDHAVTAYTQDFNELERVIVDGCAKRRGCGRSRDFRRHVWSPVTNDETMIERLSNFRRGEGNQAKAREVERDGRIAGGWQMRRV